MDHRFRIPLPFLDFLINGLDGSGMALISQELSTFRIQQSNQLEDEVQNLARFLVGKEKSFATWGDAPQPILLISRFRIILM